LVLVVLLTVRPDRLDTFRAYERQAAAVMARHGGGIERAIEIPSEREGDPYREVHIVSFPDESAYQAYSVDPDMAAWRALRDECVIRTEIMKGEEGPDYSPA
jgi:antibiotic biosynthesis monooxygenase (ABM) superfamily enzyme